MPPIYRALILIHVSAGFIGLAAFWVPVLTPKGGRVHVRAGWVFAIALLAASISGGGIGGNEVAVLLAVDDRVAAALVRAAVGSDLYLVRSGR